VSLWIESEGETALVTGDFLHHPVQCAEPQWVEFADVTPDEARATRRRMLGRAAETGALVFGTHFPSQPAGRVVVDGDVWRFVPTSGHAPSGTS
jgi:glyoxylase-like metal-dependent hydrolase (beta-lactamase superfamily II)